MSDARSRSYETHFYCALCGGPFAQVFRTAVSPAPPSYAARSDHDGYDCGTEDENDNDYDENLDLEDEFNISPEDNRRVPEEVVLNGMSHAAKRSRKLRLRAETEGRRRGIMGGQRTTSEAYDGRRISAKQMKWTKNLRAVVFRRADNHPLNYHHYLDRNDTAYFTGRGLIRQEQNWADAFASIDEDEGDDALGGHTEHPTFSDEDISKNTYGFHVYQELGRNDCLYIISSIPFHDECWSLLDLAIEESGKERGISQMNECIDTNDLWGYFRGLVPVTGALVPSSTAAALLEEHRGGEIVTRLGEVDYREAQGSGDGWQWKHEEGLHVSLPIPIYIFTHFNTFYSGLSQILRQYQSSTRLCYQLAVHNHDPVHPEQLFKTRSSHYLLRFFWRFASRSRQRISSASKSQLL